MTYCWVKGMSALRHKLSIYSAGENEGKWTNCGVCEPSSYDNIKTESCVTGTPCETRTAQSHHGVGMLQTT